MDEWLQVYRSTEPGAAAPASTPLAWEASEMGSVSVTWAFIRGARITRSVVPLFYFSSSQTFRQAQFDFFVEFQHYDDAKFNLSFYETLKEKIKQNKKLDVMEMSIICSLAGK